MSQNKVNPGLSLTDDRFDNASGGLRLLARMIGRRLRARKADVGEQHPPPRLPTSGVDKKAGLQPPGTADGKQAAPPSDCKRQDAGCPDERGDADG